jgi:hypothetical protein
MTPPILSLGLVMKHHGDVERGRPHSERAGESVLATGERAALYRVLRELSCSRCGCLIRGGKLLTKKAVPASCLPLVRICRGCAPFSRGGGLLDTLLAPNGARSPDRLPRAETRVRR